MLTDLQDRSARWRSGVISTTFHASLRRFIARIAQADARFELQLALRARDAPLG